MNTFKILLTALLALLVPALALGQTRLDVKQPGGPGDPWLLDTLMMFNSPEDATFRWRSEELGVARATWQVSKSNLGACNGTVAKSKVIKEGDAGAAPSIGNPRMHNEFAIDFAQITPTKPTSTPAKYFVRVIPLNSSGQPVKPCPASVSMVITYVALGSINLTRVEEGGTYADVLFSTTTSMTPIVEASTHAPDSTGHFGPIFNQSDVEHTAKPVIVGPLHNHRVRLVNLMPNTFHHYVVTATDKNGSKARMTEGFQTKSQSVKVTFEEVHVFDDSDDFSEGDLGFGFYIGGDPTHLLFTAGIDSGERRALLSQLVPPTFLQTTVTPNSKGPLNIRVLGVDNDELDILPVGPFLMLLLNRCGSIAASCGDSAQASTSLGIYVSGPDESFTQTFTLSAAGSSLKFTVRGKFEVTYK